MEINVCNYEIGKMNNGNNQEEKGKLRNLKD